MHIADASIKQHLSNEDLAKRMLAEDFIEVFRICEGFLEFDLTLDQSAEMVLGIAKSSSQKMIAQRIIEEYRRSRLDASMLMPEFPLENSILREAHLLHAGGYPLRGMQLAPALLNISLSGELSEKEKFIRRLVTIDKYTYLSETSLCKMLRDTYAAEGKTEETEVFGRTVRNLERGHELSTAINFWLPSYVNILLQKARSHSKTIEAFEMLIKLNLNLAID